MSNILFSKFTIKDGSIVGGTPSADITTVKLTVMSGPLSGTVQIKAAPPFNFTNSNIGGLPVTIKVDINVRTRSSSVDIPETKTFAITVNDVDIIQTGATSFVYNSYFRIDIIPDGTTGNYKTQCNMLPPGGVLFV